MAAWTERDIPDLSGRTAVVTGANSGLGYQTSRQLAAHGARVVLACRDRGRGEDALRRLSAELPDAQLELAALDLADLSSVRRFAAELFDTGPAVLDILVNNAGIMAIPRRTTADGFEMQLGTNFLGHFALTGLLLPALLRGSRARVVTLTSLVAVPGRISFDNLQGTRRYQRWVAYSQSKLADLLFALQLAERIDAAGLDMISAAAHPGYAATNLQTAGPRMEGNRIAETVMLAANRVLAQSDSRGALPSLYAATAPDVVNGGFYGPNGPGGARGTPRRLRPFHSARNRGTAQRLWDVAESLTGVQFDGLRAVREEEHLASVPS
jgi:NAD(P)-dependent dehydrogenase (short-subunit alcohol dehydrogenase family)